MTTDEIREYPIVRHDDLTIPDFYRELQQQGPIRVQLPFGEPCWLATSYDDVKLIYGDRRFGKELGEGKDLPSMYGHKYEPNTLANLDPPRQTRIRRLALAAFTPAKVREMSGWVDGMADELLDDLEEKGQPADFVDVYSWMLPLRVITGILGVTEDDIMVFRGWVDELTGPGTERERRDEVYESLTDYIRRLVDERRAHETRDLLSILVHARDDDDSLSEAELVNLGLTLLLGGFETTAAQIGSSVFTLLADRRLWEELVATPDLLPNALEELWRWIPSFRFGTPMIRWASEDVELSNGVVIPAGQAVVGEHQVANRDDAVFPRGGDIDFHRADPQPHLSFAFGAHRCMGAHLAQVEVETTVGKLLQRFPNLRLAVPPEDIPWSTSSFLRSPAELPLEW